MPADLERARPFLMPLPTTIRHFGAVGTGTVYKLINNLMGAIQIAGIAEGLAIAEQAGLDMKLVLEAVETGVAASPQVIRHSRRMVAREFFRRDLYRSAAAQGCGLRRRAGREPARRRSLHGTRCGAAYDRAKAHGPDDDEGRMIEIVSRAKPGKAK